VRKSIKQHSHYNSRLLPVQPVFERYLMSVTISTQSFTSGKNSRILIKKWDDLNIFQVLRRMVLSLLTVMFPNIWFNKGRKSLEMQYLRLEVLTAVTVPTLFCGLRRRVNMQPDRHRRFSPEDGCIYTSEASVSTYKPTQRYNPEDQHRQHSVPI
jgi:hypothetical protein